MNLERLTTKLTFTNKCVIYTPDDPYKIYERLARLHLNVKRHKIGNRIEVKSRAKVEPVSIFDLDIFRMYGFNPGYRDTLRVLKWIYQEIPREFWKYNVLITANLSKLKQSVKDSKENEIWINTPGLEKKIKASSINSNLLRDLVAGNLVLPTYEEIAKEVKGWGDYKYNFGQVKETRGSWK